MSDPTPPTPPFVRIPPFRRSSAADAAPAGRSVPPPEETRPAGTGDVVADQPAQPGPLRRSPQPLFTRSGTAAAPVRAPEVKPEATPDRLAEFLRRPLPTRAPINPGGPAAGGRPPKKRSPLGILALWADAPGPLFQTSVRAPGPGLQDTPAGIPPPSDATPPAPSNVPQTNAKVVPTTSAPAPVSGRATAAPPPDADPTPLPDPAQTRPAGTGDVVQGAPTGIGPWRAGPQALFTAGPAPSARQVPAPVSEAGPPEVPFYRRVAPAPAPVPVDPAPKPNKAKKDSVFSTLAPWKGPSKPLFREPEQALGTAVTVATRAAQPTAPTLVTGATGFVGSAVARALSAEGHTLRLLVRPGADRGNIDGLQAEIAEGDLTDTASLAAALVGCRYLVHVAADYRLWVPNPASMQATNVDGTRALLLAARDAGVERIVYCSSVAALGLEGDGTPGTEDTPVERADIIGAYKQSKYDAEMMVRAMAADGVPVVIVAPSAPVGPRDHRPTPTGKMILDAAAGRMPAYVDTGLNIVHVDDVARGHVLALMHGQVGETYILGGEDLGMAHLLAIIDDAMGRRPQNRTKLSTAVLAPVAIGSELKARVFGTEPRVTREMLAMADKQMFFSSAKATDALGYSARPARQAVADAIAWFRQAGMLRD